MGILWTILIGFIAGVIAKFVTPGKNEPQGFILTTVLGIVGAPTLWRKWWPVQLPCAQPLIYQTFCEAVRSVRQ